MIKVINIEKTRQEYVYIGNACPERNLRASLLANPFTIYQENDREKIMQDYHDWLRKEIKAKGPIYRYMLSLQLQSIQKNLILGCWCKPKKCHGDIIKKILENGI